ncbi:MAG: radical SAM/SPASM domain-containing protein [Elusimicrobiota bacterium]|jgi:MoaA/NifB/PqqE/SkfB family radical SAM enzyme
MSSETRTLTPSPSRHFAPDKILAHADRVEEWLRTGICAPVTVEFDLTNRCGHRCPHCFGFARERDASEMKESVARDLLRQLRDLGARGLTFTGGGDPLLHPAAARLVSFAAELGLDVGFITNAQALSQEAADVLMARCVWVRVSLDAATPRMFQLTHGAGEAEFERVKANIRLLARRKQETGGVATLGVGFLTSEATREEAYAFARLGRELGADYAQYRPLLRWKQDRTVDYGGAGVLSEIARAKRDFSCPEYRVVGSEHKYRLIEEGRIQRAYRACHGRHFAAVVSADLKMYLCCHMRGMEKYVIGDLSRQSVREAWNSALREQVGLGVDFRDCPPLCRCDAFNVVLEDVRAGRTQMRPPEGTEWEHKNFI